MDPAEAGAGAPRSWSRESIGMHFGTFQLTDRSDRRTAARARGGVPCAEHPGITVPDTWFWGIGAAEIGPSVDSDQEEGLIVIGLDTSSKFEHRVVRCPPVGDAIGIEKNSITLAEHLFRARHVAELAKQQRWHTPASGM